VFSLKIHSVFEKTEQFDVCDVSFMSEKGEHVILPNHEPFFTSILQAVYFTTPNGREKKEKKKIPLKNAGFLQFDGQICSIWVL
jgi:F0F1-type ATP synthase epsilon subunit